MAALEALVYGLSAVVCALVALAALRSCLSEIAAWREGRWRSADIEAVRSQVNALAADLAPLPGRLVKVERDMEIIRAKGEWSRKA
jgi:hypothetical protein